MAGLTRFIVIAAQSKRDQGKQQGMRPNSAPARRMGWHYGLYWPGFSKLRPFLAMHLNLGTFRFMARSFLVLAMAVAVLGWPILAAERSFDFGETPLNEIPKGFRSVVTGSGKPGDWKVILDEAPTLMPLMSPLAPAVSKKPVLAQLSRDPADERYLMCVYDGETFGDFTLTTRFRIVSGEVAQMAGIAFRIQDENNYYYIRASASGKTIYFYKWINGQLVGPIGSKLEIPAGAWQELTIQCKGNEIRCSLNGKEAFPALQDNSFLVGKIGFWTKSDSVTYFADARITYKPRETLAQVIVRETMARNSRLVGLKIIAATGSQSAANVVASADPNDMGKLASKDESDTINRGLIYYAKDRDTVSVILPLHDKNGDRVAAVARPPYRTSRRPVTIQVNPTDPKGLVWLASYPKSGNTYSSRMELDDGRLKMRGYIGAPMFGRNQFFDRLQTCDESVRAMVAAAETNLAFCD